MNRAEAAHAIELIRETTAGRTLLMVEHDMDAVFSIADRISVLVQGRVIATGTPAAIRADTAVRAAYLGDGLRVGVRAGKSAGEPPAKGRGA
jgi:branched-chain amino acid transport system ATP-binding protein